MGLYDSWKLQSDRDDEGRYGLSDRHHGDPAQMWKCAVCGTRFDLGRATTHAQQTGHAFTFKGKAIEMIPMAEAVTK